MRSAAGEGPPALRVNLRCTRRSWAIALQSGKDARLGPPTVKQGPTHWHTPDSNAQFVGFLVLFLCTFAPLR